MDKRAIRRQIAARKRLMTPDQIESASLRLAQRLFETEAYQTARSLYAYMPFNQEVDTRPILRRARDDGKRTAVPRVCGSEMRFYDIDDSTVLIPSGFGIPEPSADEPEADDPDALVLMPGLAFDRQGHRVGYGGGYYDRYLAGHPGHTLVALCFGFQLLEQIPSDAHDIPVDLLLWDEITL